MDRMFALSGPRVLIFDTGPLWELVLYSAVNDLRFDSLKSELTHLRDNRLYGKLSEFISHFPNKTTSPHVVTEISNKVLRTNVKGRPAIWSLVYREFSSMGMDEVIVKLLQMPEESVARFGAADVSVLRLGARTRDSVVLSVDSKLLAECQRAGVNAKHLWDALA